ncbi:GL15006 [Drosophila persimilis]|uniref:GL15006 n=1 Tax=Drosophila persimilis TaxID=7234 RepID=B4H0L6_DROPE|nr:GL15006 [Drosophila persimilis]
MSAMAASRCPTPFAFPFTPLGLSLFDIDPSRILSLLHHQTWLAEEALRDLEVVDALPETVFDTPLVRELGKIVKMLITYVSTTTVVYAQHVDGSPPLVWTKDDVLRAKSQFKRKPHMLDIVLAHYNDGCYYRAQIIEESDNDYKIFYVDYGNTEFVTLSALVPCGDFDRMRPHRAVSCYIEGVVPKSSLSRKKAVECMEYLKSKILNVEEDVMLVSRLHDCFEIRFLGDNADLPENLMKRGYAQPNEDGPTPYDSDLDQ